MEMRRLIAYILQIIGVFGALFFYNYEGTAIPAREAWFVLSMIIAAAGVCWLAWIKITRKFTQSDSQVSKLQQLRETGEHIRVTLDHCEVKSRSFQQEVISDGLPSQTEMLESLFDKNRNYKTENVVQTYIVYYKKYNGVEYKYISEPTSASAVELSILIDNLKGVDLYIDKNNPVIYVFQLPRL
jgi:hypothetical protein